MVRRSTIAVLLLLAAMAASAQQRPSFTVQAGGVVATTLPLSVLQDGNVKKQLGSGLTTTFLVLARQRDARVTGARLEIRYDLWDEVWLVRRIEFDGKIDLQRITTADALEKWWRTPVRILATSAARVAMQLDLTVLPFSSAEEEDAREWITKSGGVGSGTAGGLVDVLVGTTLSAKPISSYRWHVDLALR